MASNESNAPSAAVPPTNQGFVLRNAMLLMMAQVVATPMAIVLNAVMARYLGPQDFGYLYLVGTFLAFGMLAVDWGQSGMVPQLISRDRPSAGEVLGSALAWRVTTLPLVYAVLAATFYVLDYSPFLQSVLAIACLGALVTAIGSASNDAVRGFERIDVSAITQVVSAFAGVIVIVPVLLLGGGLLAVMLAQAACALIPLVMAARALRAMGVRRLSVTKAQMRALFVGGAPFLVFGTAMALQPSIDAGVLSKMGSIEAVGWHAAARKLIGVLATPAMALIGALYPTLSRLYVEDTEGFKRTTRDALRTSTVLAAPLAMGCLLFPDLGILIFSRESFGPAEDNLRIFAPFIFLLYFSMPLGACLAAAGRTKPWAAAQALCVVVSAVLDPILVPYFQAKRGNGGLGICIATVVSEVLMVGAALVLLPKDILDRALGRTLALAAASGIAMAATAHFLSSLTPFVTAPLSILVYLACMRLSGGLDAEQIATFRSLIARKTRRA